MVAAIARPRLSLAPDGPALALGRAHEAAGPGRRVLAALAAARLFGPVIWILGPRARFAPHPEGLAPFFDPSRLVVVRARRALDALWAAEEALRSGAAPLVAVEPVDPPALTPVRRLQLAAEAGGESAEAGRAPLCLILTPEGGSAAAVETRWWVDPAPGWARSAAPGGGPARWRLALLRDKAGPPGVWEAFARRGGGEPDYRRSAA